MIISTRSLGFMLVLSLLCLSLMMFFRNEPANDEAVAPSERRNNYEQLGIVTPNNGQEQASLSSATDTTHRIIQFRSWAQALTAPVTFVNPPVIDDEGLFCVINPEFRFSGKRVVEIVEDGSWYDHALTGKQGAILFGKGNGRPPWSHKIADLIIENGELKISHRISFGGNKGVRTRLLLDLEEKNEVSKIGIAMDEMAQGSPWGYPAVWFDGTVISPEEVEKTSLITLKPNWIELDTNFTPTAIFQQPVRVIWLQFQEGGRRINRITN